MSAKKNIPEKLWKSILANMPIPCVDIIVHTRVLRETRVLLGYRKIYPYNDYPPKGFFTDFYRHFRRMKRDP